MTKKLQDLAKQGKINERASLLDRQSTFVRTDIGTCWQILNDFENWVNWNVDIHSVRKEGKIFRWSIRRKTLKGTVMHRIEPEQLILYSYAFGLHLLSKWKLESTDDHETIVTLQQSVEGLLIPIFYNHQRLHSDTLNWLKFFKKQVEPTSAVPPVVS